MREFTEVPAPIPDEIIYDPCAPYTSTTYQELIKSDVLNISCIGEYKAVVDGIRSYNEDIKKANDDRQSR